MSPLQAIARHPFIAILPVLLGLGVALAIGLTRPPVYTAQSRLGIVNVDVSAPGALGAFGNGAAELAQAYARTLSVPELRAAVAKRTGLREDQLDGRLSASAVANAPIFAVEARGSTAKAATDLANATSGEVQRYVAKINSTTPRLAQLLSRYTAIQRKLQDATTLRDLRKQTYDSDPTSAHRRSYAAAAADVAVAKARALATQVAYQNELQHSSSGSFLRILSTANGASSDRSSVLQLLAFLGVLAGLAVGVSCAMLLTALEARRAFAEVPRGVGPRRRFLPTTVAVVMVVAIAIAGAAYAASGAGWSPF